MADTIQIAHTASGVTLYAIIRDADGAVWNGSAFAAYVTANLGTYDVAMTEQGTASRYYTVAVPALAAGLYTVTAYQQAGGAPAETDAVVGLASGEWDGTRWTRLGAPAGASIAADLLTIDNLVDDLETRLTSTRAGYLDNLSAGAVSTLDAAGVRAAVGLASANLDTQLAAIDDFIDTEVAAILVDTGTTLDDLVDDLETRLTAALATKLAQHAAGVLAVVIGTGSTTTAVVLSTVEGAAPSATDDFYNGAVLIFTSGALAGQRTDITDYTGGTVTATVTALTGAPVNGVTALIV
jgi:hypothetical protein